MSLKTYKQESEHLRESQNVQAQSVQERNIVHRLSRRNDIKQAALVTAA